MTKRPIDVFVDAPDDEDDGSAIARVTSIETGETNTVRIPTRGSQRLQSSSWPALELDPGRYVIETRMPSGSLERKQVEVSYDRAAPPVVFAVKRRTDDQLDAPLPSDMSFTRVTSLVRFRSLDWPQLAELARTRTVPTRNQMVNALGAREIDINPIVESRRGAHCFSWTQEVAHLAMIERPGVVEVFSLPLPWQTTSGQSARVEIEVPVSSAKPSAAIIHDAEMQTVLSYIGAGATLDANALLSSDPSWSAITTLQHKTDNPFAAVVAAYVLVLAETTGEPQLWDPWLDNLTNWFGNLPDAPIVQATRCLRQRQPDVGRALKLLSRASGMGLPIFGPITQLLLDGVTTFADDETFPSFELDEVRLRALRSVVMRMRSGQTLTSLTFEHRGDVPRGLRKRP